MRIPVAIRNEFDRLQEAVERQFASYMIPARSLRMHAQQG